MKENYPDHFCMLENEAIAASHCTDIKMLCSGFYKLEVLNELKKVTGKEDEEIVRTCRSCCNY